MIWALALTVLAGAATAVGGVIAVSRWARTDRGLAVALAFAGGAMVLVSVVEIAPKGVADLTPALGGPGAWAATFALAACGASAAVLLGRLVPDRRPDAPGSVRFSVRRSAVVVALAVSAHNLPEGLITFVTALEDPAAGVTLALAIALHNVPEGVAVAAPCFGGGASRARAVTAAGLSGVAEPVGAVLGYLLLAAVLPPAAFGTVFGLVAGMMLYIGTAELVPNACRLLSVVSALAATSAGGAVMGLSLLLLGAA